MLPRHSLEDANHDCLSNWSTHFGKPQRVTSFKSLALPGKTPSTQLPCHAHRPSCYHHLSTACATATGSAVAFMKLHGVLASKPLALSRKEPINIALLCLTYHSLLPYECFSIACTTAAGSAVAFGKLHGVLASKPLALTGKNPINIGLLAGNVAAGATFLMTGDPTTGIAALGATTALGGVMGAHMTASIGGTAPRMSNICFLIIVFFSLPDYLGPLPDAWGAPQEVQPWGSPWDHGGPHDCSSWRCRLSFS